MAGDAIIAAPAGPGAPASAPALSPVAPRLGAVAGVDVIDDADSLGGLEREWDELAQECSLPLCAPAWMLAWWRHAAPAGSELRIVAARAEDGALIGLAPWFVQTGGSGRVDVRFLGAELSDRVDVLCRPGAESELTAALRTGLRRMRPRPDLVAFEAVPASSRWTRRLAGGGLALARYRNSAYPAPAVTLTAASPEEWLAARSSNFRSQMGRMRRRLESRGGAVLEVDDRERRRAAVDALLRLHAERWDGRGESNLARPGVSDLLHDAAAALGPERLRLFAVELDGELVSVQLFLAAGDEVKYWNGGWSEAHADLKPSMLTILAALQDAISRGERRLDLGVGTHAYKQRFADTEDTLTWGGVIVRNCRWPRTRAELAPRVLRYRAKRLVAALPSGVGERVRGALGRPTHE
jgi:CelD/BcsL family acetyltransferase involved in cellulose biosynthesis